ncbi:MAG TPA: hypothetical protein VGT02_15105 [Methylomirabilota bacterium]|nr:hypothetical protein [Methylomirabilota bacterium]
MRRALAAGFAVLVVAGCATPRWNYEKRHATPLQLDRDLESCRREGFRPSRFSLRPSGRYDWDVVNRCMERKGYQVKPVEE